jgi:hypothetical protein
MESLLRELEANNPGVCICTSRLRLTDLDNPGTLEIDLDNLTRESGAEYLKALGLISVTWAGAVAAGLWITRSSLPGDLRRRKPTAYPRVAERQAEELGKGMEP